MPPRRQVGAEAAGDLRRPLPQLRRHRAARPVAREMARYVELRRHTDADGDILTQEGVRAAPEIGARELGGYDLLVSTGAQRADRKSTRLNSSHRTISYAVFCLKKKK